MSSKIFLLHHNSTYEALLADFLAFCGFEVLPIYTYQDADSIVRDQDFNMGIVDLCDDHDLLLIQKTLKTRPNFPIIALTQSDSQDLVARSGLPLEHIVQLPRPLADILDVVNSVFSDNESFMTHKLAPICIGSLQLDAKQQKACVHGEQLALTGTEFSLIQLLADNLGNAVSKDVIYPKVLGRAKGRYDRSIDVHVSSIRRKLSDAQCTDALIESVRGVGYRLVLKQPRPQ